MLCRQHAGSNKLPHPVLLGTDVPELMSLLKRENKALMIVTWSQAGRLKWHQPEQTREENSEASSDRGEIAEKSANTTYGRSSGRVSQHRVQNRGRGG